MESDIWAFAAALAAAAPACPDREAQATEQPPETSAESAMISGEERREVMEVLRRLPSRQREALVLRFYLTWTPKKSPPRWGSAQALSDRPRTGRLSRLAA
jgi:DNA-directed RNA polymerase specialized sigma24 family protein